MIKHAYDKKSDAAERSILLRMNLRYPYDVTIEEVVQMESYIVGVDWREDVLLVPFLVTGNGSLRKQMIDQLDEKLSSIQIELFSWQRDSGLPDYAIRMLVGFTADAVCAVDSNRDYLFATLGATTPEDCWRNQAAIMSCTLGVLRCGVTQFPNAQPYVRDYIHKAQGIHNYLRTAVSENYTKRLEYLKSKSLVDMCEDAMKKGLVK